MHEGVEVQEVERKNEREGKTRGLNGHRLERVDEGEGEGVLMDVKSVCNSSPTTPPLIIPPPLSLLTHSLTHSLTLT